MSVEHQSDDEYIPEAPAFCERLTPEEAKIRSQKLTKMGLENLYHDVINKIDSNRKKKEEEKEVATYSKMMQQSKLLEQIEKFFECDEERQKAKFMNMLIDNNRSSEKLANLESKIVDMEAIINELKDNEEHMNDVMEGYEETEKDLKEKIRENKIAIEERNMKILNYEEEIRNRERVLNRNRIFYRFVIFFQTLAISYLFKFFL